MRLHPTTTAAVVELAPAPNDRLAPRLIVGHGPPLWTASAIPCPATT
jgi:hypothetical protein